ncbi:hypothetical protein BKA81DRAFT_154324 [Phyllosticta paracitricarpa]|uniref:Uncharacterized protein n=2 Tax=Phyllosticta TaxID=121621 RepID=A0ABR1LR28_9PEZI
MPPSKPPVNAAAGTRHIHLPLGHSWALFAPAARRVRCHSSPPARVLSALLLQCFSMPAQLGFRKMHLVQNATLDLFCALTVDRGCGTVRNICSRINALMTPRPGRCRTNTFILSYLWRSPSASPHGTTPAYFSSALPTTWACGSVRDAAINFHRSCCLASRGMWRALPFYSWPRESSSGSSFASAHIQSAAPKSRCSRGPF